MIHRRTHLFAALFLSMPLAALGCSSEVEGGGGGAGGAGGAGGGGAALKWYSTCGDPVCGGHTPQAGVSPCTSEMAGSSCDTKDARCDPGNDCNALLVCTDSDPTQQPGGCPISRARYKRDIRYLSDADLKRVHDDLVAMPLATWNYRSEAPMAREHLGFIIDDMPHSPAVAQSGEHVDVYGYTSMAVAAIKEQQKQIDALKEEVKSLRKELAAQGKRAGAR